MIKATEKSPFFCALSFITPAKGSAQS
ncbi:TPA: orotate phosphoribosyltransferase, partial [Escherichia coli]|nr:orotate phosphoribosyltransferase [Escherichia coli]